MKIEKSTGPSTLLLTGVDSEADLPKTTRWHLFIRKSEIHILLKLFTYLTILNS